MRDLRGGPIRTALGCLVMGALVLTGCSEKQEASTTLPTAAAAPTSEALPLLGPADFPMPHEARTRDAVGAEAFLRYWVDLLNRQQAIPAGDPIRDLAPDCHECLRIARVYDEAAASGARYVGGELTIVGIATPLVEGSSATVSFTASEDAVSLVDSAGSELESAAAAADLSSGVTLTWSEADRGWLVAGMTLG